MKIIHNQINNPKKYNKVNEYDIMFNKHKKLQGGLK